MARLPPPPYAGGLTFWRRSIQARVVVSTVLLSAVVVSVVGWFLLQQTRDGLLDHRVDAVVAEANDETRRGAGRGSTRARHRRRRRQPAAARWSTRSSSAASPRGFAVVLRRPDRRRPPASPTAAPTSPAASTPSSVPASLRAALRRARRRPPGPTPTSAAPTARASPTAPGIVVGSQVQLPADGGTLHALLPLPARRGAGDPRAGHPRAADRRRSCCWCWSPG